MPTLDHAYRKIFELHVCWHYVSSCWKIILIYWNVNFPQECTYYNKFFASRDFQFPKKQKKGREELRLWQSSCEKEVWEIPCLLINISLWECYQCVMWYHHSCVIDWFNLLKWARGKLVKVSPSKNSKLCPSTLSPIFTYYKSVSFWSKDSLVTWIK